VHRELPLQLHEASTQLPRTLRLRPRRCGSSERQWTEGKSRRTSRGGMEARGGEPRPGRLRCPQPLLELRRQRALQLHPVEATGCGRREVAQQIEETARRGCIELIRSKRVAGKCCLHGLYALPKKRVIDLTHHPNEVDKIPYRKPITGTPAP